MKRTIVGAVVAVTALTLVGCSSSEGDPVAVATTTTAATTTTSATPKTTASPKTTPAVMRDFWIRVDRDGYATMNVNGTYTDAELESAFNEQKRIWTSTKKGDGWFIEINCGDSQSAEGGARQANGKFAITALGAARTGLEKGGSEFEALPNRKPCPADLPVAAPAAASANDVVDAFTAAGLPTTNRVDRTISSGCESLECVQMVAVDEVSVYQFAEAAKADRYATAFGADKVYLNGLIAIRYKRDGKNPIDESLIPQYNAVLDQVMGG
ncbi:hypothetical protein [Rhodococcus qingshengii]|uniref:hypothetical protein n=1 Tax=Rhodococcus qingshengii TaxID=334542 RepID=UPI0022B4B7EB|nr:hypothetical protein [Rhodococcus qingshengii]MCZ4613350.1 hypothetical protein [Rhodococcus qingshengii]